MDGYVWYVFGEDLNGKYWYYAQRIPRSNNLTCYVKQNTIHMNACSTKKEAVEIAREWNECAHSNGNSIFNDPKWFEQIIKEV